MLREQTAVRLTGRTLVFGAMAALVVLLPNSRVAAVAAMLVASMLTLLLTHRANRSIRRTFVATAFGLAPAAMVIGAIHDLIPTVPPIALSRGIVVSAWVFASRTVGTALTDRVQGLDVRAFLFRSAAVVVAAGWYAGGLLRQFLPGADLVTRLGFAILEEDNASFIGVAREVRALGPRGGGLAETFGTGFVVLANILIRLSGGPLSNEASDPRQEAITSFVVSSMVAIILTSIVVWMVGTAVQTGGGARKVPGSAGLALEFFATLLGAWIAIAVVTVIPMRTGFLSFVWGLVLLALGTAISMSHDRDASRWARSAVLLHLLATTWLLLGSWPFVVVGIAPAFGWVILSGRAAAAASHRGRIFGVALLLLLPVIVGQRWVRWGALAEVLASGRSLLTVTGSAIRVDIVATIALAVLLAGIVAASTQGAHKRLRLHDDLRTGPLVVAIAPVGALALLYLGLILAAAVLTGGELNYAGDKLWYGIVASGLLLATPVAVRLSTSWSASGRVMFIGGLAAAILFSPTIRPEETWWDRSRPQRFIHAESIVSALKGSDPTVPLRCLPPPDLVADLRARRAAYECVRFVEDAFNEDRQHGYRIDMLATRDRTFEELVEIALQDEGFDGDIARVTMRGGWAGLSPDLTDGLTSPWPMGEQP